MSLWQILRRQNLYLSTTFFEGGGGEGGRHVTYLKLKALKISLNQQMCNRKLDFISYIQNSYFLFVAFLREREKKKHSCFLPSAPFYIKLTFCLTLLLMCNVSQVTSHTFDRLQWRTKVVKIVEEQSVSSRKAKTWSDWPWVNHRCAVAYLLCWMRFLEQLFWNLSKVVDKTNGSILL